MMYTDDKQRRLKSLDRGIQRCRKCRPPKNRNPRPEELCICTDTWLQAQTAILKPRLIVLLGKVAATHVLARQASLTDLHGKVVTYQTQQYLVTYHPAAAMRFPRIHGNMNRDFAKLRRIMAELEG